MNPDEPSYVFKTSKLEINIALSMGDQEHFLSNEYCYVDAKWNRCKDFRVSVYHPVLRKQVPLFTMECEGETGECYAKFFHLINEAIAKVAAGRVFDPIAGFMADEAGGVQEGLRRVYGNPVLEKLKTCEFHFLLSAQIDKELVCIARSLKSSLPASQDQCFKRKRRVPMMSSWNLRNLWLRNLLKINGAFSLPGFNGGTTEDHTFFRLLLERMHPQRTSQK